jgi:hypothetical protein
VSRVEQHSLEDARAPIFALRSVTKRFGGIVAVEGVDFDLLPGEVHALVGENGAGYVHVGESHRGYLGSGSIDFNKLFRALAGIGYSGPIAFESFSSTVVSPEFCAALGVWRDMWADGHALAAHARAFIEDQLVAARRSVWGARGGNR